MDKMKNILFGSDEGDEDEDYGDSRSYDDEKETTKPKKRRFGKSSSDNEEDDMAVEIVNIKVTSWEDTRVIADNLLSHKPVILNIEGVDVALALRIIDYTCGVSYAIDGELKKISQYIFLIAPANVSTSGVGPGPDDFDDLSNSDILSRPGI